MKKSIVISLVAAGLLFVGCGEGKKPEEAKAAETAQKSTTDEAKDAIANAAEATKKLAEEKAAEAKKAAGDLADKAKEATADVAEATKAAAEDAKAAIHDATASESKE